MIALAFLFASSAKLWPLALFYLIYCLPTNQPTNQSIEKQGRSGARPKFNHNTTQQDMPTSYATLTGADLKLRARDGTIYCNLEEGILVKDGMTVPTSIADLKNGAIITPKINSVFAGLLTNVLERSGSCRRLCLPTTTTTRATRAPLRRVSSP